MWRRYLWGRRMDGFGIPLADTIEVGALKPGTRLRVETMNSVYNILVQDGLHITITGGSLREGGTRFPEPVKGEIIGALLQTRLKYGKIVRGMRLAMELESGGIETSIITEVKIDGPDDAWHYSMEWRKENTMSEQPVPVS